MGDKKWESCSRQNKHELIMSAIESLENCVGRLEDLRAMIIGEPASNLHEGITTPRAILSLSIFLSEAPDIINKLIERINAATCSIQEEIL